MVESSQSRAAIADAGQEACRGRLLVVDEPSLFRDAMVETLRDAGHDVASASTTDEVLSLLQGQPRDVLLIALGSDAIDALDLLRRVRAEHDSGTLAVLATSEVAVSEEDITRLLAMGCEGLVSKFAPPEHVLFRVRSLVYPRRRCSRVRPRAVISLPVEWTRERGRSLHQTFTVSSGGLFVRSEDLPSVGDVLALAFALPGDARVIRVLAEVLHTRDTPLGVWSPAGFGVRFLDIDGPDEERLDGFVAASLRAGR